MWPGRGAQGRSVPGTVDQAVLVLLNCHSEYMVLGTAVQGGPKDKEKLG